jgi:membrane associated rhomboid family serine protease
VLIVPSDSRFTAGRRALATWALVAANILAFVLVSRHDEGVTAAALAYYAQSDLDRYEYPAYLDTLHERGDERQALQIRKMIDSQPQPLQQALRDRLMLGDLEFQDALDRDRLITPDLPDYARWKAQRDGLHRIVERNWTAHLALRADALRPWAFFTYQFLHAGWGHLFGNMLMLVLVGRLVEGMVGAWRYLAVYLVAGALAGASFVAVHAGRPVPLVGASGAIAGIMGMFTATFARRRVRFFYAFFGFVGFARWPALWLLPYWVGWELLQLALSKGAAVAYEAHVGGLIAGALAAPLFRALAGDAETRERLDAPERAEQFEKGLQDASQLLTGMHVERARALLEQLHRQRPDDARPLQKLYTLGRLAPHSAEYHDIAARVLCASGTDPAMRALVQQVRAEYVREARPGPALPAEVMIDLFEHIAVRGDTAGADRLLKPLLTLAAGERRVQRALLRLANKTGPEKARAYQALAMRHFS